MKQNKQKNINKKFTKGFTLLELLVVVLIIGILAGIALPQYRRAVDKTRFSTMMNIAKALAEANERYYMLHDTYSTKIKDLDIGVQAKSITNQYAFFDWGNCQLYVQKGIYCTNDTSLQNQLMVGYIFSTEPYFRNNILCMAKGSDTNSRYAKVCKSLTSKSPSLSTCEYFGACMMYRIEK